MQNNPNPTIQTIAVAGAGTMGAGIAQLCAQAGYTTILYDINPDFLQKASQNIEKNLQQAIEKQKITPQQKTDALQKIFLQTDIKQLQAQLIIEAIIEQKNAKIEFFNHVAQANPPNTILASNTSSIPITQIAAHIPHPQRIIGMHFFNPPTLMKLVEVIETQYTQPAITQTIMKLASQLGKTPVLAKDAPGFIVNRIARPYYTESLLIAEQNFADLATIDQLLESCGFKMGAFKLMDLIGVDTNLAVTKSMYELFFNEPRFCPSRLQQQKVDALEWGKKTGKGFYEYNK